MTFKNPESSHAHSLPVLNLLYQYDSFLDSLEVIADYGCGAGHDINWWATLTTRDDPPEPRNYLCYAVDKDISRFEPEIAALDNVKLIKADFEGDRPVPRQIDLLWCHDAFQYAVNPLSTLRIWNETMSINGMLLLSVPQNVHYRYNRLANISPNGCYYNYNVVNLMYMLAVNGFDCRDAYFYKDENNMWLYTAVYKSDVAPMDPRNTSWYDLLDLNLLNDSVKQSILKNGFVDQNDLVTTWLDRDFHFIKE